MLNVRVYRWCNYTGTFTHSQYIIYSCIPVFIYFCVSRELRASFNKIVNIPPEIGKLKRLRRLVLNSNRIKKLPNEIGRLDMLEELIVSENVLEELPHTIATMSTLRILKLENNKLKALPYELADVVTLEEVNCANNPELEMLPPPWRGDSESILFICRIHRGMCSGCVYV